MKKLIVITAVFALMACFLTGCRFGRGDNTTTTQNNHTLPETTGATITMPTMDTTTPSTTKGNPPTDGTTGNGGGMTDFTEGNGTTDGPMDSTNGSPDTNGDGTTGNGSNGKSRRNLPGKY